MKFASFPLQSAIRLARVKQHCQQIYRPRGDAMIDATDPQQAAACRRLWAAVALQAISDAELDPTGPAGAFLRSHDFRTLCDLAGLDAEAAQERVNAMRRGRIAAARAAELDI